MSREYASHPQVVREQIFYLERTGTSAHIWIGPFGLHLWRHKSKHRRGRISPDFDRTWR